MTTFHPRRLFALGLAAAAAPTLAQTVPPNYGHDFVTIGAPGNRDVTPAEAPNWDFGRFGPFGGVDYEFRITRTEVTNTQYLEFLNVYTKIPGRADSRWSLGRGILLEGFDPHGDPILRIWPGAEQAPADPSWDFAARYVNWLHNDKGSQLEDFETGAYDTSTFRTDPTTGKRTDQLERSPGSRYFIPNFDEWTKAAHYDPDKYGEGEEGYWYHPGGSDEVLASGRPGEPGAQTGAGEDPSPYPHYFPVGSFPQTDGPWGLLDTSGGASEWTETVFFPDSIGRERFVRASSTSETRFYEFEDPIDYGRLAFGNPHGFRVGSVVPAPGGGVVALIALGLVSQRRRRS
jgi:formylglycine-generating enzyme required for sulfatase activity